MLLIQRGKWGYVDVKESGLIFYLWWVFCIHLLPTEVVSHALLTGMNSQAIQRIRIKPFTYAKLFFT